MSADDIRIILAQTTGLVYTLSLDEILQIRDRGDNIDSTIISFLALIMVNQQQSDDDHEFELRMSFQLMLLADYDRDIIAFLKWLHSRNPSLCDVVVNLCDIAFLERLYLLHDSYEDALRQRERLCRWASSALDKPEYLSMAENLVIETKVREVREEIDDTRIYVDEMRYRQWAVEHVGPDLRRFQRQVQISGVTPTTDRNSNAESLMAHLPTGVNIHVSNALESAFTEFCHNKFFGIDSYLSRRVRHGTFIGQLRSPIRKAIDQFKSDNSQSLSALQIDFIENLDRDYSDILYHLKDFRLYFKCESKPLGLLDSTLYANTPRIKLALKAQVTITQLIQDGITPTEIIALFNDLCWDFLQPDLNSIQAEFRRISQTVVRPLIRTISQTYSTSPQMLSLEAELDRLTQDLFSAVGGWFSRPANSSMSATIGELTNVVSNEINKYFPNAELSCVVTGLSDIRFWGITAHNLYDIFYILFHNTAQYSDHCTQMNVHTRISIINDSIHILNLTVSSKIARNLNEQNVTNAIKTVLEKPDNPDAMIREGKSGLAKIQTIVNTFGDNGRFDYHVARGLCQFDFTIPVILMDGA